MTQDPPTGLRLPPRVLVLGLISVLTAVSSVMIPGLQPVFLVAVLGASMTSVGVIEGMAGAGMSIAKMIAGPFSDWMPFRTLARGKPSDISQDEFVTMRRTCVGEWPRDFRMRAYCADREFSPIRKLRRW